MTLSITITIILICIAFQAFFSGAEMIVLSANRIRLKRKAKSGSPAAALAVNIIDNPRWFLATTSTGTNMAVIISSVIAALYFETLFGHWGELVTIATMSPILLMFGEIIPRAVFQQRATEFATKFSPALWIMSRIFAPITFFIMMISRLFYPRAGKESHDTPSFVTRDELALLIRKTDKKSDVKVSEKKLIHQIFQLTKTSVDESMIPLVQVSALPVSATVAQATELMTRTGFSRVPVYSGRIDNLNGIIRSFDILDAQNPEDTIESLMKEVPYIPETKRADELLIYLKKTGNSMAIVVDEYGGAVGIITIEDLLEEVVGEIRDEYDKVKTELIKYGDSSYVASARMEIDVVNDRLKIELPTGDYDTLGGFLLACVGKIPATGDVIVWNNIEFTIKNADKKTIHDVMIDLSGLADLPKRKPIYSD